MTRDDVSELRSCVKVTCSVTSLSQCESETGVCNRLDKANFNEDFEV